MTRRPPLLLALAAICVLSACAVDATLAAGTKRPADHASHGAPAPPAPAPDHASRGAAAPNSAWRAIAIAEDRRDGRDPALLRGLADPDPALRARAALAIGRLQDSTLVAPLLPLLADTSARVRHEAIFALGQIGHRSAREALEKLLPNSDPDAADLAIEALGKLGQKASTPVVVRALDDPAPRLRGEAAVALWRLADSTALDGLLAHHDDPDPEVRWRVIYALEKVVAPDRVVLPVALHLDDPEWLTRAYVARTLGRQKSPRATAYLIQKLDDSEVAVVVNALRALQQIADTTCETCAGTIARSLGHRHPYVRSIAATVLGDRFAWVAADSAGRQAALDSLARHAGSDSTAGRRADPDAATRGAAAAALIARGAVSEARARAMLSDSSVYVRAAILRAMPWGGAVLACLDASHPLLERMTAAEVLGTLREGASAAASAAAGGPRAGRPVAGAVEAMRAGLDDPQTLYAASCAGALADLGDSASVPRLARAWTKRAADADADARISIRDALRALAGRRYADSLERVAPPDHAPPADYPPGFETPPAEKGAVLHTTAGDIRWEFYTADAPQTVRNFVTLATKGYFDGCSIHRVVPNFVIQDGDPTGTGSGGPGYTIRCEYNRLRYDPGMVGMALSGKDTGGSQWFITHSPQHHLDGRYTIFAHVTEGMDVVKRVVQGDKVLKVEIVR